MITKFRCYRRHPKTVIHVVECQGSLKYSFCQIGSREFTLNTWISIIPWRRWTSLAAVNLHNLISY